jgi:hypothetical protein
MSKQAPVVLTPRNWRKFVVALVLALALTGVPLLTGDAPGPLTRLFVQTAQAGCPIGGTCG